MIGFAAELNSVNIAKNMNAFFISTSIVITRSSSMKVKVGSQQIISRPAKVKTFIFGFPKQSTKKKYQV